MRALHLFLQGLLVCPLAILIAFAQPGDSRRLRQLAIEWQQVQPDGTIELTNGELTGIQILRTCILRTYGFLCRIRRSEMALS